MPELMPPSFLRLLPLRSCCSADGFRALVLKRCGVSLVEGAVKDRSTVGGVVFEMTGPVLRSVDDRSAVVPKTLVNTN